MDNSQGPVSAEFDGWTIQSASKSAPMTEAALKESLGATPEQAKAPAPAATPDPPAAETGDDAPAPPAVAVTTDTPAAPAAPPKDKRDPEKRIGDITGKWRSAERERDAERTRRESLERELTELRAKATAPPPVAETKPTAAPVTAGKPAPDWDQYEADGKSWKQYTLDHNAWSAEEMDRRANAAAEATAAKLQAEFKAQRDKSDADRKQLAQDIEEQAVQRQHQARMAKARAKYADLDTLVHQNLADLDSPFLRDVIVSTDEGAELLYHLASKPDEAHILAQLQPSQAVGDAIRDADSPLRLLSHFAQHPDEFSRINALPPQRALLALGRLDRQLEDARPGPSPTPVPPPVTRAAGPIRPVVPAPTTGSGSRVSVDDLAFGPDYVHQANKAEADARKRRGL